MGDEWAEYDAESEGTATLALSGFRHLSLDDWCAIKAAVGPGKERMVREGARIMMARARASIQG